VTSRTSLPAAERRLRSQLHQLLSQAEGFLHGSLIEMSRRCGNPRCRCAREDALKHRSLYLGQTRSGKSSMLYVPADLEATVRRWVEDYQRAAALLEELCAQGRERVGEAKTRERERKRSKRAKAAAAKGKSAGRSKGGGGKTTRNQAPKPS
jgi:hypothetical protein